jgi:hypothetical protein
MSHHTNKASTQSPTNPSATGIEQPVARHSGCCDSAAPTHDDIARRAYDIYVKTGCKNGHCTQNWHQAEQSLRDQAHAGHHAQQHSSGAAAPHAAEVR